ncbi:hypothetical protein [Methanobacterium ferruginis]|uniref:hypothetical protein n=1 Tax=Methanobacterium ferruginis TaxID=710191 RepID=UPI0025724113|nr:hypothetical protein [Methanobacterium ferruginis]BDZ67667.1 hypothetical protein GCM10025860_11150 [Methanobacterium ferruginis]
MDKKIIYTNSIAIAFLALIATLAGLFWKELYQHDTISGAAQMMGQDLVTLGICIPILLGTLYLIRKDSLRGKLIWMGTIFYFLYSYASMAFLTSYNQLFLVYVAIFSLSLYTLLGELLSLDIRSIKKSFTPGVIQKITAIFLVIIGLMLAGMWLKMIVSSLLTGVAPSTLETYTTLVIQALDLGVVVPAALITGLLLFKGKEWGYALASILLMKVSLLGSAILSMIYFMVQNGVNIELGQAMFFIIVTVLGIIITVAFYSRIKDPMNGNKYIKLNKGDKRTMIRVE